MKKISENAVFSSLSIIKISDQHQPRCHRGLDLRVWLNNKNNLTTNTYVFVHLVIMVIFVNIKINELVLSLQFRALSDSLQTQFAIIISLIDDSDERIIHSYEQITYLSMKNCQTKFNIYLLYSTRPKNPTKTLFNTY